MASCYLLNAPKKPVNLSLNSDLLRLGKELALNLSALAEEALAQALVEAGRLYPGATKRLLTLTRDGAPLNLPPGITVQPAYAWMLPAQGP